MTQNNRIYILDLSTKMIPCFMLITTIINVVRYSIFQRRYILSQNTNFCAEYLDSYNKNLCILYHAATYSIIIHSILTIAWIILYVYRRVTNLNTNNVYIFIYIYSLSFNLYLYYVDSIFRNSF